MDPIIKQVYLCYLGKDLGYRTASIIQLLEKGDKWFFQTYGTKLDSISDFIRRGEKTGLDYFL